MITKRMGRIAIAAAAAAACAMFGASHLGASEAEKPVVRDYSLVRAAPAPRTQSEQDMIAKTGVKGQSGCLSCHTESDAHTMHASPAVVLGCTDCHGGNPSVGNAQTASRGPNHPEYIAARDRAHVLPRFPGAWHWPSSANPVRSYALLNREAGVRPLRQSVRLPRRARILRRLPYRGDRGRRALADGHGRDALGRRRLQ
jgi:hypothetical protein